MGKLTDVRITAVELYFLPITLRVPLKFGTRVTHHIQCARVRMQVEDRTGRQAWGWGETPLAAQWAWPSATSYEERERRMQDFCQRLAQHWITTNQTGHPMEVGYDFQTDELPALIAQASQDFAEPIPHLAALICLSPFDIALHDAYGILHACDSYQTYSAEFLNRDLAAFITPATDSQVSFANQYPADYLVKPATRLQAWHLVGGLDPLEATDLTGNEPNDGYPVTLVDWIKRDGLTCLKIKLRGNDATWDYDRLVSIGKLTLPLGVQWLTADFNCTVSEPAYVNDILDRLQAEHPEISAKLLYVEQPFPYELDEYPIDVHSVSQRKPLFLDESAHDWRYVKRGRELGWTGVALKTCKTQTGALLSLCWAKAHGMALMVQDLTNPMLAQIPHVRLAAHAGTIMGVETNGMQFYPEASAAEAVVHPGLYQRVAGEIDLSTLGTTGFGYRVEEISRQLPAAAIDCTR